MQPIGTKFGMIVHYYKLYMLKPVFSVSVEKTRAATPFWMLAAENFNVGLFSDAMGAMTLKLGRNIPWMDLYNFAEND